MNIAVPNIQHPPNELPDHVVAVPLYSEDHAKITAATMLGLSRSLVYRAAKSGDLPTVKVGGRVLVPVSGIRRLLGEEE